MGALDVADEELVDPDGLDPTDDPDRLARRDPGNARILGHLGREHAGEVRAVLLVEKVAGVVGRDRREVRRHPLRVGELRRDRFDGVVGADLEVDHQVEAGLPGLLHDGLALRHDIGRLDHARPVRAVVHHPRAAEAVAAWIRIVRLAEWKNPVALRRTFPDADPVRVNVAHTSSEFTKKVMCCTPLTVSVIATLSPVQGAFWF